MKIKDLPQHERPREKLLLRGVDGLRDYELLAILLRTGREGKNVIEIAKDILGKVSMKKLLQLNYQELIKIKGIDSGKASTLLSAFELTKRALEVNHSSLPVINEPQDAVAQLADIRLNKKEHFVVLYLNARNQVIQKETISIGTLNASLVHPREVFEPAVRCCAAQIILSHNHPSGDPDPSDADLEITKRMKEVGKLMGIEVMDHVIVTKDNYYSFAEMLDLVEQ